MIRLIFGQLSQGVASARLEERPVLPPKKDQLGIILEPIARKEQM